MGGVEREAVRGLGSAGGSGGGGDAAATSARVGVKWGGVKPRYALGEVSVW